jgi:DNA-binding CsgD family transcriptional regulator
MEGQRERSIFEGPGVCLIIEAEIEAGRFIDIDRFSQSYGLTKSETRALTGLVAGKTVDAIAREYGRSRETIRTQLKSLYSKTGARGQADLLRLVSGMKL